MASWRQPDQEGLGPGWGRPSFNRESSVRQIAPGLMARDNRSPVPQESFYSTSELQSTSDGHNNSSTGKPEPVANGAMYGGPHDRSLDTWPLPAHILGSNNGPATREAAGGAAGGAAGAAAGAGTFSEKQPSRSRWSSGPWSRGRWTRKRWLIILGILLFIVILAIVIPVAVTTTRNNNSPSQASSSSPSSPSGSGSGSGPGSGSGTGTGTGPSAQPSSSGTSTPENGAVSGSGIGASQGGDPSVVFFQHTNGDIWQTAAQGDGQSFTGKVLSGDDIRNGTPIAAVQYVTRAGNATHIVYAGKDNVLRDSIQSNGTGSWTGGQLQAANYTVSTTSTVGLSLLALRTDNREYETYPLGSIRLYYGGGDGVIREAQLTQGIGADCLTGNCFTVGNVTWQESFIFPSTMNGNAGVYVTQPLAQNNSILVCSTTGSQLTFWTKQTLPSDVGMWTQGATSNVVEIAGNASIALAGARTVFYEDPNNDVHVVAFDPTNAQSPWGAVSDVAPAAPNSRLAATFLYGNSTPAVILQNQNTSVAQYVQSGNAWHRYSVPVN